MKLLLDTNRYIDAAAGTAGVEETIASADEIYLPFIAFAELAFGFQLGTQRVENEIKLTKFISATRAKVIYPDEKTTRLFATLKVQLRRQGTQYRIMTSGLQQLPCSTTSRFTRETSTSIICRRCCGFDYSSQSFFFSRSGTYSSVT